jgi:hypothetical protein
MTTWAITFDLRGTPAGELPDAIEKLRGMGHPQTYDYVRRGLVTVHYEVGEHDACVAKNLWELRGIVAEVANELDNGGGVEYTDPTLAQ